MELTILTSDTDAASIIVSKFAQSANIKATVDGATIHVQGSRQFYDAVGRVIAEYIIENKEHTFILKEVNLRYPYFDIDEQRRIVDIAMEKQNDQDVFARFKRVRKQDLIIRAIKDYVKDNPDFHLDGFVNFRLKGYIEVLEEVVAEAVDDFLVEREHREFVKLLGHFVNIQEPKYSLIKIAYKDGQYLLSDENGNQIIPDIEGIGSIEDLSQEDLLISFLVIQAPRHIMFCGELPDIEVRNTIKETFEGRIIEEVCDGRITKSDSAAEGSAPEQDRQSKSERMRRFTVIRTTERNDEH